MLGIFKERLLTLVTAALLISSSRPASAFDWAGKLERDLEFLKSPSTTLRRRAVTRLAAYPKALIAPHVLRALNDEDPSVQRAAATIAMVKRLDATRPIFIRWLKHWDATLRIVAAQALGRLGGKRVLATLIRALSDPEPKVRLQVVKALVMLHDKGAVIPLLGRIQDAHTNVRLAAIEALGAFRDPRAVIPIMEHLDDPSATVRTAAIVALGKLGDPRAAPAITRRLSDYGSHVVRAAIETLGKLRYRGATEPLIELLRVGPPRHRAAVAQALARLGTDLALRALISALTTSTLASAAQQALSEAPKQDPKYIIALISNERTPRRVALMAVDIARRAKLRAAIPTLIEQLDLRRLPLSPIIRALGALGDPRAAHALVGLLDDKRSIDVKLTSLRALNSLIDGRATDSLLRCLHHPNRSIRRLAIRYLHRLRARDATRPLARLMRQSPIDEARQAATALAAIADPRAIPDYIWLLRHRDRALRRSAIEGLAHIPAPKTLAPRIIALCKRHGTAIRTSGLHALGAILRGRSDPHALTYLFEMLNRNDLTLSLAALDALAALRDPRITPTLLARLPHLPLILKRQAIQAIGNQPGGRKPAIATLRATLRAPQDTLRAAAAWALMKLGAREALPDLERTLRQTGWEGRTNAAAAIASFRQAKSLPLLRHLAKDRRNPFVRANALLGLGWLHDRASLPLLLAALEKDPSPWARSNALRAIFSIAPHPIAYDNHVFDDPPALAHDVAEHALDQRLRRLARRLAQHAPSLFPPPTARPSWLGLYLLDSAGRPLQNKPFLLITPTGLIKAAYAGPRAQAWEEQLPSGRCHVSLPPWKLITKPSSAP